MQDDSTEAVSQPTRSAGRFANPKSFVGWGGLPSVSGIIRWSFTRKETALPTNPEDLDEALPVCEPDMDALVASDTSMVWMGHATVLVRMNGFTFLTDPVWSDRCSPLSFAGPKRYRPPPCRIDQLPRIDFVLISHNHFDHLDAPTVRQLVAHSNNAISWFVPSDLADLMRSFGCRDVVELGWGDEARFERDGAACRVVCLPAQHWSRRGAFDTCKTLWSSWAVLGATRRFFFAGDTGYCGDEFRRVGRLYGPFDAAAIPIGCYEPRWFMRSQHVSPEDAVQVHKDILSRNSLGVHWGTFDMGSTEHYLEPRQKLDEAVSASQLDGTTFKTTRHGELWTIPL